jgi:hypothetical protein
VSPLTKTTKILNTIYMPLSKSFTTVTPLSKLLAMILFIAFPFIGFYLGTTYEKSLSQAHLSSTPQATCVAQKQCSEEAKQCPDGSFVFRQRPDCAYAACPKITPSPAQVSLSPSILKTLKTKEAQIQYQLAQRSHSDIKNLIITYKNTPNEADMYTIGRYGSTEWTGDNWFVAAKVNGIWTVTAAGNGIPSCDDVNPYHYPKSMVPVCALKNGDITAR